MVYQMEVGIVLTKIGLREEDVIDRYNLKKLVNMYKDFQEAGEEPIKKKRRYTDEERKKSVNELIDTDSNLKQG